MKIRKTASGKKLIISREEWERIGKEAQWGKSPVSDIPNPVDRYQEELRLRQQRQQGEQKGRPQVQQQQGDQWKPSNVPTGNEATCDSCGFLWKETDEQAITPMCPKCKQGKMMGMELEEPLLAKSKKMKKSANYSDEMAQKFKRAFSDSSIAIISSSLIADNVAMLRLNNGVSLRLKLDRSLNDAGTFDIAMAEENGYSAF